jgi:hypothetical protein
MKKDWCLAVSLKIRRKEECEELCRKRIELEKTLGARETDYEKCIRICRAFTTESLAL